MFHCQLLKSTAASDFVLGALEVRKFTDIADGLELFAVLAFQLSHESFKHERDLWSQCSTAACMKLYSQNMMRIIGFLGAAYSLCYTISVSSTSKVSRNNYRETQMRNTLSSGVATGDASRLTFGTCWV